MDMIEYFSPSYSAYGISAMIKAAETSILGGRPYGGVSTLIHKDYVYLVKYVFSDARYVVIIFDNFVLVNVYFPNVKTGSLPELIDLLAGIAALLIEHRSLPVIWGGGTSIVT